MDLVDGILSYGISLLWQEAKKYTEPYIDRVAMVTKPHLDKLHIALKPYTEKVLNAYRKVITTTTFLHHEV